MPARKSLRAFVSSAEIFGSLVGTLLATFGIVSLASAQEASQGTHVEGSLEEVVVTGSRVGRSTFNTPNPVTVLDASDIENLGLTNVGAVMAQLPQNSSFFASNNVGLGNFNVGAQLANLRGLNPFFGTRTLTLIDTRRVVPTTTGGGVDITLIPSMLVARTEVVTGGASAVYGSDAVAGVVNIILDTKLTGFKGQADFGQTSQGDGADGHLSAAYGNAFAGDRGHFVIGGEYEKYESIGICSQVRDWCSSSYGMFTNPGFATPGAPGYGQPHYIVGPDAKLGNTSQTGVLAPCLVYAGVCIAGPQVNFNAAGTATTPFNQGLYALGAGFFGFRQGGDGEGVGAYDATTMRPEVKRYTALGNLDFELGANIHSFLEGSYARSEAVNPIANGAIGPYSLEIFPNGYVGSHIAPDNAFLPAAVAAQLPNGAMLGRNVTNIVAARNETNNDTWRVTGGLNGPLAGTWNWDAYYEYGRNENDQALFNNVVNGSGSGYDFLNWALDAVKDSSGKIVCRQVLLNNPMAAGCVPLNLFGANNADPAAIAYAFRTLKEFSVYTQQVFSANLRGDLFSGFGAGAIKSAVGIEWRREHGDVTHDLANQPWYNQYFLSYGLDYSGTISVLEGYAEVNVPILHDLPLAKYLELDGAYRETQNKNENGTAGPLFGESRTQNFPSWKLSGIWDLTEWLRFRGTRSRDVRAPGFRELYQAYAVAGGAFGSVTNPWTGLSDPAVIHTGGDINLKPEKADTTTVGFVLSPKAGALEHMQFSADWYQINLNDAIVGPPFGIGAQNIVTQCYLGVQSFCDRMTGEGTADILTVDNTAANLGQYKTEGVDFEADYNLPLQDVSNSLAGSVSLRLIASYLYKMTIDAGLGATPVDYAGQSGPTGAFGGFNTSPKWQANAFATYANGPFSGTVQFRYIGPGKFLATTAAGVPPLDPSDPGYSTTNAGSINDNTVASAVYVNLSGAYNINKQISVFGTINNLFDRAPPIAPGGNGYPTNPVYFDTYGMSWKLGVRVHF
jgi:iron complex outermembrane recepter protein